MRRIVLCLTLAAVVLAPAGSNASTAGPPRDYQVKDDLSQPVHDVVHERFKIPMRDGTRLAVEVWRPTSPGRFGVILELSPYNSGLERRGYLPGSAGSLAGYFAPRGYAVALADLRGTGNSEGCMDYMGPVDRLDAYDLVEWLGARPWSNGRVGMTGVSYVGSTPILAAAMRPPSLVTIVPVAGIARFYDHGFQAGVPYYLQWAGHAGFYELFDTTPPADRDDEGWARNTASGGCGTANTSTVHTNVDLVTGRYTPWHAARDFTSAAANAPIPMFMVQGFTDGSVRPISTDWFFRERGVRPGDKAWLGQWGHNASNRFDQWVGVLHRWFDRHVLQRDVDTGPPVEVFLNVAETGHEQTADVGRPSAAPFRGPVRTATTWPASDASVAWYPWPDGTLRTTPSPAEAAMPFAGHARSPSLSFTSEPFTHDVEIAGSPEALLSAAVLGARVDLFMTLTLIDENGGERVISTATINPELRHGLGTVSPIVPGEVMTLRPPAQPTDVLVRAGQRIRLDLNTHHRDKVPTFAAGTVMFRIGGVDPTRFVVPIVSEPTLYDDPIVDP